MSVKKLNKIVGLAPEKETLEEHQGPAKSLEGTIDVVKSIKNELREVEHYVEQSKGSEKVTKRQLEEQVMKAKQEVVKLGRMLEEEFEAGVVEEDGFEI